jgi:hypothetical protein
MICPDDRTAATMLANRRSAMSSAKREGVRTSLDGGEIERGDPNGENRVVTWLLVAVLVLGLP